MLPARRLCEAGAGFVTMRYGGWDMHGQIKQNMDRRGPEVDRAVAALVEDLARHPLQIGTFMSPARSGNRYDTLAALCIISAL